MTHEELQLCIVGHLLPRRAILDNSSWSLDVSGSRGGGLGSMFFDPEQLQQPSRQPNQSIKDIDEFRSPGDSIFDKTNQRTSELTTSVFGDTRAQGFLPPFVPLYVLNTSSVQSLPKEDDTWISMTGGGQIRRNSVASVVQSSPCARVEKRKKMSFQPIYQHEEEQQ
ncbi:hypothetical protein F5887DRAFT_1076763 [Amanita rubescens]|nr:hypothetical protein F5887DRAFT_1076763 [Amanita rubescens]